MSETKKKTFAVLTSGGDAPGMNAAVRSVVRTALHKGHSVYGIFHGYEGLMEDHMDELQERSVSNIINRGGTILYTARSKEFMTEEGQKKAAAILRSRGIDGLVVIGGDGSFRGAQKLSALGIPTIGIPGTIDNDLAYTEMTLGFDTAVNVCVDAVRSIRATSRSHDRPHVVEVMGRHCGDIALMTAASTGAEIVIAPEAKRWTVDEIAHRLQSQIDRGNYRSTIVVAEGSWEMMAPFDVYKFHKPYGKEVFEGEPMTAYRFASVLKRKTTMPDGSFPEVRHTVIGYTQRGAQPTARDATFAFESGVLAVNLLQHGVSNRVIGMKHGKVYHEDIEKALKARRPFNRSLYNTINGL